MCSLREAEHPQERSKLQLGALFHYKHLNCIGLHTSRAFFPLAVSGRPELFAAESLTAGFAPARSSAATTYPNESLFFCY